MIRKRKNPAAEKRFIYLNTVLNWKSVQNYDGGASREWGSVRAEDGRRCQWVRREIEAVHRQEPRRKCVLTAAVSVGSFIREPGERGRSRSLSSEENFAGNAVGAAPVSTRFWTEAGRPLASGSETRGERRISTLSSPESPFTIIIIHPNDVPLHFLAKKRPGSSFSERDPHARLAGTVPSSAEIHFPEETNRKSRWKLTQPPGDGKQKKDNPPSLCTIRTSSSISEALRGRINFPGTIGESHPFRLDHRSINIKRRALRRETPVPPRDARWPQRNPTRKKNQFPRNKRAEK